MIALLNFIFVLSAFLQPLQQDAKNRVIQRNGLNFEYFDIDAGGRNAIQDSRGLLWFGTDNEVTMYNGYGLITYQRDVSSDDGLKGGANSAIVEDHFGRVWVANHSGYITVFVNGEPRNLTKSRPDLFSPDRRYFEADIDQSGDIWISQRDRLVQLKVYQSLDSTEVIYHPIDVERYGNLEDLLITSDNRILVNGNRPYEFQLSESGNPNLSAIDLDFGDQVKDIYEDELGNVMYITNNFIYLVLDDAPKKFEVNQTRGNINSAIRDKSGTIWAATDSGVYRLILDENDNLVKNINYRLGRILDSYLDRSGNIFFVAHYGRLLKLSAEYLEFQYVSLPKNFSDQYVHNFIIDHRGRFWIGGHGGTYVYDPQTEEFMTSETNASFAAEKGRVFGMIKDSNGYIWSGTVFSMIKDDPFNDRREVFDFKERFKDQMPNESRVFHDFRLGPDGMIWGSSTDRLFKLNPETNEFTFYFDYEGEELRAQKVVIDENNHLWLWNRNRMDVFDVNNGKFERLDKDLALEAKIWGINYMTLDDLGRIWISFEEGVFVFDRDSKSIIKHLNKNTGLPSNFVWEIIKDNEGLMWLKQAKHGSFAVDPETFEIVRQTRSWTYNPENEMYYGVNAASENGMLMADGIGGFYHFSIDESFRSKVTPKVLLKQVSISDSVDVDVWNSSTTVDYQLKYNQNDLRFSTLAVHFDDPGQNEYAYYMEGYDDNWSAPSKEQQRDYLNLNPGTYTFYAKASNADGVWSEPVALATISIRPPLWANFWAYSMYLILISFVGYRFYRAQLNKKVAETETERLKEVDEFKSRFFTNISHEFRTPLTVIMGMADRIEHESAPMIKRNATKLLELINQILELSKVESNQASIKLEALDLVVYSRYLMESLSSLAREREIDLQFSSDLDSLPVILDKQKVDLILHNLLSNALKFTDKGGKVRLHVQQSNGGVSMEVADTGIGMDKKDLNHIFDRFFQTDLDKHNYEGTGIGLALTNELVHLLDGHIEVESEKGVGSTFRVYLPCEMADPKDLIEPEVDEIKESVDQLTHPEGSEVVLIVEDNLDVRSFIKQILKDHYQVVTAHDGKDGYDKAVELIPDLIISDVMMPYKDGLELTDDLKNDDRTSHIPVILLTAKADVESRLSGLKTGADVYLSKPFNEQELMVHIHNLIQLRQRIRARYSGDLSVIKKAESPEDEFVVRIHASVMANLDDEDFGIDELCKEVGASRTQLHRKLKALTGKSTSLFVRDIRLEEGRKLLVSTRKTISEIAFDVGFSDPNYFSKLFTEKFQHSPSKEREIHA